MREGLDEGVPNEPTPVNQPTSKMNTSILKENVDHIALGAYNRVHFAVMAIESAALKMHVSGREMHDRLKAQGLIHNRLLARYDDLHTQSLDWVAADTVETLRNWESGS